MSELEILHNQIQTCTLCKLHAGRTNAVPGEGPAHADIIFIGEGPGFHEDKQGRPFVGAAGRFLEELLESIDFKREQVFITNVVKCRPPANRDPEADEIEACRSCDWKSFCQAGCPGAIWQEHGTFHATDDLCELRRELYELSVRKRARTSEEVHERRCVAAGVAARPTT